MVKLPKQEDFKTDVLRSVSPFFKANTGINLGFFEVLQWRIYKLLSVEK